jgi:hypothetical protein
MAKKIAERTTAGLHSWLRAEKRCGRLDVLIRQPARERVMRDESVDKPDIGCGRFVTRGDTH